MDFLSKFFPDFSMVSTLEFSSLTYQAAFLSILIWGLLLTICLWYFIKVWWSYSRSVKAVKYYETHLQSLPNNSEMIATQRREIAQNAMKNPKLGNVWKEFDQSLIESNGKLYNTVDAAYFFNTHTLASGLTENRLFAAVPGFLTALGVLGTFLGLTFGLGEIHLDQGTQEMQKGISAMVSGASTAFLTSLWGVLTSLVFNWYEKRCERKIKVRIQKLQKNIDEKFHRAVVEQILVEIKSINENSHNHLAILDEKIGSQLQQVMDSTALTISNSIIEALATSLTPAINQLMNNTREGSEKVMENLIQTFIDKIGGAGETQKLAMDNATQALAESSQKMMSHLSTFVEQIDIKVTEVRDGNREMLEQMRTHFSNQLGNMQQQTQQQNQQAVEFMQKLANSMVDFQQKNQQMMDEMQNTLRKSAAEQAEKLASREQQLSKSADSFMEELAASLTGFQQQNQLIMSEMQKAFNQNALEQTEKLSEREQKLSNAADHFMEKLAKAIEELNSHNREMLNVMQTELSKRIDEQANADKARADAFNQQVEKGRNTQQALTESVQDLLETQSKHNAELSTQLSLLSASFERIAQANAESVNAMDSASTKLNSSASAFDTLSNRIQIALTDFGSKIATTMSNTEHMLSANREAATQFNNASRTLENSVELLGNVSINLDSSVKTSQQTFNDMQGHFTQFAQDLKSHIGKLNEQVSQLLSDYAKQVQDQTNHRLNEWNTQTNEYSSAMVMAVKALSDTIDEIETKLRK